MKNKITFDFHIHCMPGSKDSRQTLLDAVKTAKKFNLDAIAITDHNSIDSLVDIDKISTDYQIKIIPGIEFSVIIQDEIPSLKNVVVHILGLGITTNKDLYNQICQDTLNRIKEWETRLIKHCELFFNVKLKSTTKSDLKKELVELGKFKDKNEVKTWLKQQEQIIGVCIGFKLNEIIDIIHKLGGLAVLAHPTRAENHVVLNNDDINLIVDYLVKQGLDGIELFHHDVISSKESFNLVENLANKYHLLISLGSDRHNSDVLNNSYFNFELDKIYDFDKYKQDLLKRLLK